MRHQPIEKPLDTYIDGESRLETYWEHKELQDSFKKIVKGNLPKGFKVSNNTIEGIIENFGIRGIQFGNWVTLEDKYNYLAALQLSMLDLNSVLKFTQPALGQGLLALSFGARGKSSALAHFEPGNFVINTTRYKREDVLLKEMALNKRPVRVDLSKEWRFVNTGGIGSFAHEYGHFLDYYVSNLIEPVKGADFLTGPWGSVSTRKIEYPDKYPLHQLAENLFQNIIFDENGKETRYRKMIKTEGSYINMRQEIFARMFEQYIFYKLRQLKRSNKFLSKKKYNDWYYLKTSEIKRLVPLIDQLMDEIRKRVN
ncbi:LPD1 domain-containing protein [Lishizhenia sp.]|uniref:LPD1 domain-containing protein n=1 Tax=Lishizhenia sp. TaxID=2497594 RepID=UPI00299DD320|nr:LPD1 domain-containing protein [Lishizhenia sp.]MDX1446619.1 LPD1 domain-containing protein [Lishizhenia sp.]